jgi:type II secretory pathway pseudopilin PulG
MTLVEVMVGVFLASLVLGGAFQIFSTSQRKVSRAATQQTLASEVRNSLKVLAQDFKAVKADSLEVNSTENANTAVIKFDRYMVTGEGDQEKLAFDRFESVVYEFRKPFLTRTVDGSTRTIARHVDSVAFSRPEAPGGEAAAGGQINYDEGWAARIDISMVGSRKIPGSVQIASHTERVSVFMIEEYYRLINKNRFLSMATLSKDDGAKVLDEEFDFDAMFAQVLDEEQLAKLTVKQLEELLIKENKSLVEVKDKLAQVDESIAGIDTRGDRTWYTLWLGRAPTEVTELQNDLKKHTEVSALTEDLAKIDATIDTYEATHLKNSFSGAGLDMDTMDKNSQEYRDLKEAYDIKMRDYSMKEAHDAGKEEGGAEYVSMVDSYNPANLRQGVITDSKGVTQSFTESSDEFEIRQKKAEIMHANLQKVDLTWRDEKSGEESVKKYTAAKDLRDLAETKLSFANQRDNHQGNIKLIEAAKDKA